MLGRDCKQTAKYLWVHIVDTTNTHNKGQLGLILNIEPTLLLSLTLKANEVLLLQATAGKSVLLSEAADFGGCLTTTAVEARIDCRWEWSSLKSGSIDFVRFPWLHSSLITSLQHYVVPDIVVVIGCFTPAHGIP